MVLYFPFPLNGNTRTEIKLILSDRKTTGWAFIERPTQACSGHPPAFSLRSFGFLFMYFIYETD